MRMLKTHGLSLFLKEHNHMKYDMLRFKKIFYIKLNLKKYTSIIYYVHVCIFVRNY